jgi:gamma-glutamylcyclotransferase (GGCT)/AIG2-like uncharacterized protein YtfP
MIHSSRQAPKFESRNLGKILIFVYGTLMHPRSRDLALHHNEKAERSGVNGYKKSSFTTKDGKDFETIDLGDGKIDGDVLSVNAEDFERLKQWESLYHVIPIKLKDGRQAYAFQLNEEAKIRKE